MVLVVTISSLVTVVVVCVSDMVSAVVVGNWMVFTLSVVMVNAY